MVQLKDKGEQFNFNCCELIIVNVQVTRGDRYLIRRVI